MQSVESPRTPPPSSDSKQSPLSSTGFGSPLEVLASVCSIAVSAGGGCSEGGGSG
jgi:hypothetical protein